MVEQALDPLATDFPVRAVGQDRGVLERDVHLIVETIRDPALDLLASGTAFIHRHVVGVMDVVIRAFGTQGRFELGGGQGVSVISVSRECLWVLWRQGWPHREQARSHTGFAVNQVASTTRTTVGASLLAIASGQPASMAAEIPQPRSHNRPAFPTTQYSFRRKTLQSFGVQVQPARVSLRRGSGWCC